MNKKNDQKKGNYQTEQWEFEWSRLNFRTSGKDTGDPENQREQKRNHTNDDKPFSHDAPIGFHDQFLH